MTSSFWRTVRFVILCLAIAGVAAYHTWQVYSEKAPAQLTTETWGQEYKGQHWVSVKGMLVQAEAKTIKEGDGTYSAYIPMGVAGEPKSVVVYVNAQTPDALNEITRGMYKKEMTITGYIPNWSHLPDDAGLVNIAPDAVKIEIDERPHLNGLEKVLAATGGLCVLLVLVWLIGAVGTMRDRSRLKKTRNEPVEDLSPFRHYVQ